MTSRIEAVQDYLTRGWTPFLYSSMFTPGENWQDSKVGDLHLDVVRNTQTPVALLLGKPSGIVAIDIDVQNGGSADALFRKYGEEAISDTRIHKTASGGWHLLFKYPDNVDDLKGVIDAGKWVEGIGPGIDFLGDRRHIQAPPTSRIGHPKKPNGNYSVLIDREPAEMPEQMLRDWLGVIGDRPTNGVAIDKASPLQFKKLMDLHRNNVQAAKDAVQGTLDNTFYSRIASSMRIAKILPDSVLSYDDVEAAFTDMPYEVKDFSGKALRAREFAQSNPWEELSADEFAIDIPADVAPEDVWEYLMQLRKRRLQVAVQDRIATEKIEREASKVSLPEFELGGEFLNSVIDAEEWLIDGLLHHEGKALLSAAMKSGKSTMMLEIIRSLTTGTPFLGRFKVPKPLTVAFYDMELGRSMAQRWLRDVTGADFNRLHYVSMLGRGGSVDFRSKKIRENTARQLSSLGVDVLIVDPVSPVMSALGISENDSESVRPFLDSFDQLAVEAGLSGVIITAHTGHENKSRARGSTAFGDWPTALWNIQKEGEDQDAKRSFAAFGRDVNVPRGSLVFNHRTRGYTFNGENYDHLTQETDVPNPFPEEVR